jgi:hypothetical protein
MSLSNSSLTASLQNHRHPIQSDDFQKEGESFSATGGAETAFWREGTLYLKLPLSSTATAKLTIFQSSLLSLVGSFENLLIS